MTKKTYDILCIGLGISGLYFGYKSMKYNKKILFIEKDCRVGGRIKSVNIGEEYYAEGCAARYFNSDQEPGLENDGYITKLLEELGVTSVEMSNGSIQTDTSYEEIIGEILNLYSDKKHNSRISFATAVESLGHSINDFSIDSGYPIFKEPINMDMTIRAFNKFSNKTQNIINGGYEHVCKILYNIIKEKYKIKLGTTVTKIEEVKNGYIINDKYLCKKIVFTGTIKQFNIITKNICNISKMTELLNKYYFNYRAIRMYLKIDNPWWNTDELFYRWNSPLLNQITIYSQNYILIYANMYCADILYNMIDYKYRVINNFINSNKVERLTEYIEAELKRMMDKQDIKISALWYKYTDEAVQFVKPMEMNYDKFYKNIQQNHNFYMLSGDYTQNPGWVNSCLYIVEKEIDNIMK